MTEQMRRQTDEDGLKECDGQMRQKHIEMKRLGGRVEEELAKRGEKWEKEASLNTETPSPLTHTFTYTPKYQVSTQIYTLNR